MTAEYITIISHLIALIIGITLHEAAHGFVAKWFGDPTAEREGRLTLNPVAHLDPLGTVILPAIMFLTGSPFLFGYAKPVPVDDRNLHPNRLGKIAVSLAGPLMNVVLAIIAGWLLYINPEGETFGNDVLQALIVVNLILASFNLLPILPLDGGRVINALLPKKISELHSKTEPYGMLVILGLVAASPIFYSLGINFDPLRFLLVPIRDFILAIIKFCVGF